MATGGREDHRAPGRKLLTGCSVLVPPAKLVARWVLCSAQLYTVAVAQGPPSGRQCAGSRRGPTCWRVAVPGSGSARRGLWSWIGDRQFACGSRHSPSLMCRVRVMGDCRGTPRWPVVVRAGWLSVAWARGTQTSSFCVKRAHVLCRTGIEAAAIGGAWGSAAGPLAPTHRGAPCRAA